VTARTSEALMPAHPEIQTPLFREVYPGIVKGSRYYDYAASVAEVQRRLGRRERPLRILEVGCGTGRLIVAIAALPEVVAHAVDVDPERVSATKTIAAASGRSLHIENASATDYRCVDGGFDAILFHGAALSTVQTADGRYVVDASSCAERRAVIEHAVSSLAAGGSLGILVESERTLEFDLSGGRRYVRRVLSAENPARRTHSVYAGEELLIRLEIVRERCPLSVLEGELRNAGLEPDPSPPTRPFFWSRLCGPRV
jgi:SAM-dependent methyltransferase